MNDGDRENGAFLIQERLARKEREMLLEVKRLWGLAFWRSEIEGN
jgi:hypothetical protein